MVHREVETTRPFFPRELVFDVGHVGYASMAYAAWRIPFPRELVFDVESCKSHAKGLSLWQADVASWEILYVFFFCWEHHRIYLGHFPASHVKMIDGSFWARVSFCALSTWKVLGKSGSFQYVSTQNSMVGHFTGYPYTRG